MKGLISYICRGIEKKVVKPVKRLHYDENLFYVIISCIASLFFGPACKQTEHEIYIKRVSHISVLTCRIEGVNGCF